MSTEVRTAAYLHTHTHTNKHTYTPYYGVAWRAQAIEWPRGDGVIASVSYRRITSIPLKNCIQRR
jgi:hypothetical protein